MWKYGSLGMIPGSIWYMSCANLYMGLYILNITCQNLYHMPYQPENPISPHGPVALGVI